MFRSSILLHSIANKTNATTGTSTSRKGGLGKRTFQLMLLTCSGGLTYYWWDRAYGGPSHRSSRLLSNYYSSPDDTSVKPTHDSYDVAVVGGGIIGACVARELRQRYPDKSVVLLEKESTVATHQTSHNSGVIHAGIYDAPDSLKTVLCVKGNRMMYDYCEKHDLPAKQVGKLVVATGEEELPQLDTIYQRAQKNGVEGVRLVDADEVKKMEPSVNAIKAMYCPSTGIADFAEVARHVVTTLQREEEQRTAKQKKKKKGSKQQHQTPLFRLLPHFEVEGIATKSCDNAVAILGRESIVAGPTKVVEAKKVITCAGLHMDTVSRMAGGAHDPTIVPFRGRYWELKGKAKELVSANVYPLPRPGTGIPVGVHVTPTVSVERGDQLVLGPGAALALHKEGYSFNKLCWRTIGDILFSAHNWTFLVNDFSLIMEAVHQDISKAAFVKDAQRLVPSIRDEDVIESYSGVMAQAFDSDGKPLRSYAFESTRAPEFHVGGHEPYSTKFRTEKNVFNLRHAPSPAATSAFALAEEIVNRAHREIFLG